MTWAEWCANRDDYEINANDEVVTTDDYVFVQYMGDNVKSYHEIVPNGIYFTY